MNEEHYKEQLFRLWLQYCANEEHQTYEVWKTAMLELLKDSFDYGYLLGQDAIKKNTKNFMEELLNDLEAVQERIDGYLE